MKKQLKPKEIGFAKPSHGPLGEGEIEGHQMENKIPP